MFITFNHAQVAPHYQPYSHIHPEINLPSSLLIVESNDIKTVTFKETAVFSTYIFAVVVGPHAKWEDKYKDIPLRLYCRKSLAKHLDPENLFDITKESFQFLEYYL